MIFAFIPISRDVESPLCDRFEDDRKAVCFGLLDCFLHRTEVTDMDPVGRDSLHVRNPKNAAPGQALIAGIGQVPATESGFPDDTIV